MEHGLGRMHVADDRDWTVERLAEYLAGWHAGETLAQLAADPLVGWPSMPSLWRYLKALRAGGAPAPAPAPAAGRVWPDADARLNQLRTNHCVGFGWAGWGNTLPVDDHWRDADVHAIYYAAKVIDGEPLNEDGSTVRSGAKAMRQRGRLAAYAFTARTDVIDVWLRQHGPVVVGTDWTEAMFSPDGAGRIAPAGAVAGGHCYVIEGDQGEDYVVLNSWGSSWGKDGRAVIAKAAFATLLAGLQSPGEACLAAEL